MRTATADKLEIACKNIYFALIVFLLTIFGFYYGLGTLDILLVLIVLSIIISFAGCGFMLKDLLFLESNSIVKMVGIAIFIGPLLNVYVFKGIRYVLLRTGNSFDFLAYPEFALLVLIICLILIIRFNNGGLSDIFSYSIFWGIIFLLTGGILSSIFSAYPKESFKNTIQAFVIPFFLFVSINIAKINYREAQIIIKSALGAALIPLALGCYEFYINFGFIDSIDRWMFAKFDFIKILPYQNATFGNVGHTMDFMLLLLPMAIYFLFKKDETIYFRIYMALGLMLMLINTLIVFSRSGIITIVMTLLVALLYVVPGKGKIIAILSTAGSLIIAGIMAGPLLISRFQSLIVGDVSTSERMQAIYNGMSIFGEHVITGVGTGVYYYYDRVLTAAHSLPVSLAAENGIWGLVGYLFILFSLVRVGILLWRLKETISIKLELALWLSCLEFFFQGTIAGTNFSIMDVATWGMLFWAWQGMLVVRIRQINWEKCIDVVDNTAKA